MWNPVQPSVPSASRASLATRYPRIATLLVVAGLFVISMGLLYATALAVAVGQLPFVALAASSWLLSVLLLALVVRPYAHRLGTQTKDVPGGMAASVESGCARNGATVRSSWLTTDDPSSGTAEIVGLLPWDRHLVVDEWLFASLGPTEREALLVREAALVRARHPVWSHLAGPAILAGGAGLLALASLLSVAGETIALLLVAGCAVLYGFAAKRGVEKVFRADEHAARKTSTEAVVGLLETEATQADESGWRRWPLSVLFMHPTAIRRIERVRTR